MVADSPEPGCAWKAHQTLIRLTKSLSICQYTCWPFSTSVAQLETAHTICYVLQYYNLEYKTQSSDSIIDALQHLTKATHTLSDTNITRNQVFQESTFQLLNCAIWCWLCLCDFGCVGSSLDFNLRAPNMYQALHPHTAHNMWPSYIKWNRTCIYPYLTFIRFLKSTMTYSRRPVMNEHHPHNLAHLAFSQTPWSQSRTKSHHYRTNCFDGDELLNLPNSMAKHDALRDQSDAHDRWDCLQVHSAANHAKHVQVCVEYGMAVQDAVHFDHTWGCLSTTFKELVVLSNKNQMCSEGSVPGLLSIWSCCTLNSGTW